MDIEGSGEATTVIKEHPSSQGVIVGQSASDLRSLSVIHRGSAGSWAVGIYFSNALMSTKRSPRITHVTVDVTGGNPNKGIYCADSFPLLSHVTIYASGATTGDDEDIYLVGGVAILEDSLLTVRSSKKNGYGIRSSGSSVMDIRRSRVLVSNASGWNYGLYNDQTSAARLLFSEVEAYGGQQSWGILNTNTASDVIVDHSVIIGGNKGIRNDNSAASAAVGASRESGTTGTVKCASIYDANYNFNASTCP